MITLSVGAQLHIHTHTAYVHMVCALCVERLSLNCFLYALLLASAVNSYMHTALAPGVRIIRPAQCKPLTTPVRWCPGNNIRKPMMMFTRWSKHLAKHNWDRARAVLDTRGLFPRLCEWCVSLVSASATPPPRPAKGWTFASPCPRNMPIPRN